MSAALLQQLCLLHLADSALPIGLAAHSFGLETLVADGALTVALLPQFIAGYLSEVGGLDGGYCRAAHRLNTLEDAAFVAGWCDLNLRLSALKQARESRQASAVLGRRLLSFVAQVEPAARLRLALDTGHTHALDLHHPSVFGLSGGVLGIAEDLTVSGLLQQMALGLISACQRLLPLGQSQAHQLAWSIKPLIIRIAESTTPRTLDELACWVPSVELASLRHPQLATRLFVS